jgi:hypothetical protein
VLANLTVERRSHQELANDLKLGVIDAAVVWNFVAVQGAGITALPLPAPWPRTAVVLCALAPGADPAGADRLLAAWSSPAGRAVFARLGYTR